MESFLTKLTLYVVSGAAALVSFKILSFYLLHQLAKEKAYDNFKKKEYEALQQKKLKQRIELEDILLRKELEPYYITAKDLFHDAIQAGNLNHEQILYIKKIINESLDSYINDYKYTHYKNDAHEIYSKLKSSHISVDNYKKIIQLIKTFEAQCCDEYITVVPIKK
ncbi:hypothetical protein bsdE14_42900 [Clostridium omnivorum]|uniref:Uncharacterized protein n=2 Tax=Clostridium omnivorum TaxID=1604902 RepID=A0ABQ5NC93_9CLOT|nr:hypothetical protein bsdE14_42900 [Clostridium sp. E14]